MVLTLPLRALAAIGRQGTRAVALSVFIGLAVPPLATLAKPLLLPSILALLVLSFLRTDVTRLRTNRQMAPLLLAVLWIMGILPAAFGYAVSTLFPPSDNGLMLALVMQAAAPPIMSTAAFAALLGFDATLSLAVMVLSMLVAPMSAPILVEAFTDGALQLDTLALGARLGLVLCGTAAVGFGLRWWVGAERVTRGRDPLNGCNVLLLLLFAVAFMDGVAAKMLSDPLFMAGLTALTFLVSLVAMFGTMLVFRAAGRGQDLMLGFAAGHRNLGLMVAATGGLLPETTWLYVAVAQFPVYLFPFLLRPLARRLLGPQRG
ncbi:MAG: hypothetical protein B7Z15_04805 [Rhizobiales bacterium 32-66-8]|nr:MAG: hypothetical protein B7Z15_04805 [Rhizobiales bacterium 32-66-8]